MSQNAENALLPGLSCHYYLLPSPIKGQQEPHQLDSGPTNTSSVGELTTSLLLVSAGLTARNTLAMMEANHPLVMTSTITRINYLASRCIKHNSGSCEEQVKQTQNYIISTQKLSKELGARCCCRSKGKDNQGHFPQAVSTPVVVHNSSSDNELLQMTLNIPSIPINGAGHPHIYTQKMKLNPYLTPYTKITHKGS